MSNFHSVIISEDNTLVVVIGRDISNNGVLGMISVGTLNNANCNIYSGALTLSLTSIRFNSGSSEYFYSIYESSKFKITKESALGSSTSNVWTSELGYYDYANVLTIRDKSMFLEDYQEIYTLGLINTGSIFFMVLNESNGSLKQGVYILNLIPSVTNIEITGEKHIYILIQSTLQHFLFTFNQESKTFNNTFDSVSRFKAEAIGLIGDMLVTGGTNINNNGGVFK